MTIFCSDIATSHMQSFKSDAFNKEKGCYLNSNKSEQRISNTMAMSVGNSDSDSKSNNSNNNSVNKSRMVGKRQGKRPGRKPAKIDERAKLERSRQSAKECRARKKLRYQYLEELVLNREKAVFTLREELETYKQWCIQLDRGNIPEVLIKMIANEEMVKQRRQAEEMKRAAQVQSQRHMELPQHQHAPSTSSNRVYVLSSSPSSSSSSSSSSPSPPQASGASSYSHLKQQQQQPSNAKPYVSRLPPPYSEAYGLSSRSSLTRQMAFDKDTDSNPLPLSEQYNTQTISSIQNQSGLYQQQQQTATTSLGMCSTTTTERDVFPALLNSQTMNTTTFHQNEYHQSKPSLPPQQQNIFESNMSFQTHQGEPAGYFQQNHMVQGRRPIPPAQQPNSLGVQFRSTDKNTQSFSGLPKVKTEPPTTLCSQPSLDDISDLITQHSNVASFETPTMAGPRMRSLSNPVTMTTQKSQGMVYTTPLVTSVSQVNTGNEVGLFSGIPLTYRGLPAATVVDSDSSDESANTSQLFQSSSVSVSNKRTLSAPISHHPNKKAKSLDSDMDLLLSDSFLSGFADSEQRSTSFSPMGKLNNLTATHCMGSTGTMNTPSASPFGFVPRNTDSPMTTSSGVNSPAFSIQSGNHNVTPSSSTNPSPVPYSSSSFLEHSSMSSTLSSAMMESEMDTSISSTALNDNFLFSTSHQKASRPVVCSETGLSATISEPIPEWYSFLADLQEENNMAPAVGDASCLRNNTDAINVMPFEPKQHVLQTDNFLYPSHREQEQSSILNVPNIIEELSSDDSA